MAEKIVRPILTYADECHHAGADSYQRIMGYFKPQFWLGMTASPDTNNYDIYSIFDHEIAYEIRLEQALQEDLLCPFHYFGITDIEIDGQVFDDNAGVKNFASLVSDERVRYVIEQAEYYGFSGERVKELVFCSCKAEARELSGGFNMHGYRTDVLTGDDSQEKRERAIERLTDDNNKNGQLDYIFTVDIFNEGWGFPGGKIVDGETPQQALAREIIEELDTKIEVGEMIDTVEYDYPSFHLPMKCFWCTVIEGGLILKEHEAAKWLSREQLGDVDWLPADRDLIDKIRAVL